MESRIYFHMKMATESELGANPYTVYILSLLGTSINEEKTQVALHNAETP